MEEPNHKPKPTSKSTIDKVVGNIKRKREEELAQAKAQELQLDYRDLVGFQPNPEVVGMITKDMVKDAHIFAFAKEGSKVLLAIANPENPKTIAALTTLSQTHADLFKPVFVSDSSMTYLLSVYDTFAPDELAQKDIEISSAQKNRFGKISNLKEINDKLKIASTSDALELIFAGATGLEASDIHIEPTKDKIRLRFRLDGVLQDVAELPATTLAPVISRIKMLASLKLNIKESSQDGRFSIRVGDSAYDIRVSVLPTQYGESAVMRLLPQEGEFVKLTELGLSPDAKKLVDEAISEPNGLILNTGPTGSGKTTTLYAVLNQINSPATKIVTVEDPVEYRLEGVTQTQVNPEEDYTFANALRSIVRQDPDVILIGEIRDTETATIAVDASLTGHLVLSTLHTNDAAGAIPRLIELGAKPNLFADALRIIIAQRLVRKVCPQCRTAHTPNSEEIAQIKSILPNATVPNEIFDAKGCEACNGTGYKGRIGIFEILKVTPEIEDKITNEVGAQEIRNLALSQGMVTLTQDGMDKVIQGLTTLEELDRVIQDKE